MTRKLLLMKNADLMLGQKWKDLAVKHSIEIVRSEAKDRAGFLKELNDSSVEVVAATVPGTMAIGGFTSELISSVPPSVKALCHQGAGYDSIGDANQWHSKGVQVSNTPDAVVIATADTAVYLTLGALRNFNGLAATLRKGAWKSKVELANEPIGKTVGIVGLGGIGAVIRDKLQAAFDFGKFQYFNRNPVAPEIAKDTKYVAFDELLSTSDVIIISVPLNKSTHHLINREAIEKCKDGVIIVNTARGPVIDEQALVDGLNSGKVKSVGLDVFEEEPKVHPGLIEHENALLLPHVGTHTIESRQKMEQQVIDNVDAYLSSSKVINLVPECRS